MNDHDQRLLWAPSSTEISASNLSKFLKYTQKKDFNDLYAWSITDIEEFWGAVVEFCAIIADDNPDFVIKSKDSVEDAVFFDKTKLNFAENLLKRRDDKTAITFICEDKIQRNLSYHDIYNHVSSLEQWMSSINLRKGDRVGCYLPNIPEAIIGMLATATHGAIWSTCSPDFGASALIDRFGQINPKILFITDGYFYNGKTFDVLGKLPEILDAIPSIEHVVIIPYVSDSTSLNLPKTQAKLHLIQSIEEQFPPKDIHFNRYPFNQPLYIVYSSGTTGVPKCIVHGAGGTLLQHMKEHQLHCDIKRDDVIFYFTTCSWMMWHWLVSTLASEASILLYDGAPTYPRMDYLFELADKYNVKLFGTSAKYLDSLSKHDVYPKEAYELKHLRLITSTGSPLMPLTFDYVYAHIKSNVCLASISGGTDIVSCFVLGNPITPVYRGEIQTAGLGLAVDVLRSNGEKADVGEQGELVCTQPFPCRPVGFWNDPGNVRYHKAYYERFPGMWHHGDFIEKTTHKGFVISGRSDATLNPGGVRIGTAEIYRQVEALDFILESIAVGQPFDGDERVILFVKMKDGIHLTEDLAQEIKQHIRKNTTPRHVPSKIIQVPDIPRTKNNKIAEIAVKDVMLGHAIGNIGSLLNPESLVYFKDVPELRG
ncbi:MAG: acetoacetate--CoA ligase [Alphaproteobacteria bacterium]|nr:acetoacetate--CoA ligase [Alphaproteobacteria bacterium]